MKVVGSANEKQETARQLLGSFLGLDSIEMTDFGESEQLTFSKDGKSFSIRALGNKFDGGFFAIGDGSRK